LFETVKKVWVGICHLSVRLHPSMQGLLSK